MYPVLFKIGPLTFYSWGLMVALGFLIGLWLTYRAAKKTGYPADKVLDCSVYALAAGIVGARLFYILGFWPDFQNDTVEIIKIWDGGMVFWGGLLFAIGAIALYCRRQKISVLKFFDLAAGPTALGYAIGRIGCLLNGCCYGNVTTLPWGIRFPHLDGLRQPTQLYSSLAGLIIFLLLAWLGKKQKFSGQVFAGGLMLYCFYRFLDEFLRDYPQKAYWGNLTANQWLTALVFVLALVLYYRLAKKRPDQRGQD